MGRKEQQCNRKSDDIQQKKTRRLKTQQIFFPHLPRLNSLAQ